MVGTLLGLPEIWLQQCSVWEMIYFTPSVNMQHCIEHGIYSQKLWNQSIWEMQWGLKDVHSMLGILSGLPEIWIQLYSVWETIHYTPSANIGLCIEQGIYSQNLWSGLPKIWMQQCSVWEMIHFTPMWRCSIALNKLCTVRNYETKVSEKWYEAGRVCMAC